MKPSKETIKLAEEYRFDSATYLYSEGGFDIFSPLNSEIDAPIPYIGEPIYIIQRGEDSYIWQGVGKPLLLSEIRSNK